MVSGAYSSIFIATPLLAQMKEREPDMKKLAARVQSRRAKESQKERVVETPSSALTAQAAADVGAADAGATDDAEPSNAELEKSSAAVGNGAKRMPVTYKSDVRSHRDGAAKRPQPQNKPRSQRKK
jgi:preprotein translocase subunit SecF